MARMVRKQVYLEAGQNARLKRRAAEFGRHGGGADPPRPGAPRAGAPIAA